MADKRIRLLTGAGDNSAEDRISNLPQPIIHLILSQLSGKDVIRTCVLSKSLLSAMTCFPSLDLDSSWFKQGNTRDHFLDYVKYSIKRLNITHTTLEKFRIRVILRSSGQARRAVEAIDFAITNHVELLDIDFKSREYSLPRSSIIKIKSSMITTLNLAGLRVTNWNDNVMALLSVVENLSISNFLGLKEFNFCSTKIRSVSLKSCYGLKSIKIQSPSLQSLIFTGKPKNQICGINVSECQFLKILWLADAILLNNWVDENIPKLLHLVELKLIDIVCGGNGMTVFSQDLKKLHWEGVRPETLKIRAKNLESLTILNGFDPRKIHIETRRSLKHVYLTKPSSIVNNTIRNLADFFFGLGSIELEYDSSCNLTGIEMNQHKGFKLLGQTDQMVRITVRIPNYDSLKFNNLVPPANVLKSTGPLEFTLCLETDGAPMYHHSFVTLWNWVASFPKVEFLTLVCQSFKVLLCLEQLKAVSLSPMYDLNHLTVRLVEWTSVSHEMIECLLSTSPNIETMSTGLEAEAKSIKFHYGSRIIIEDDPECCRRLSMRCWRHSLKKVELKNFDRNDKVKLIDYLLENTKDLDIISY